MKLYTIFKSAHGVTLCFVDPPSWHVQEVKGAKAIRQFKKRYHHAKRLKVKAFDWLVLQHQQEMAEVEERHA